MDDELRRLRERVSEQDRAILAAVNARLELVRELKRHKERHGLAFLDPDRERQMLEDLRNANAGPLSDDGVRRLLETVLELTKREV